MFGIVPFGGAPGPTEPASLPYPVGNPRNDPVVVVVAHAPSASNSTPRSDVAQAVPQYRLATGRTVRACRVRRSVLELSVNSPDDAERERIWLSGHVKLDARFGDLGRVVR